MGKIKRILAVLITGLLLVPANIFAEVIGTITYIEGRVDRFASERDKYLPVVIGDKVSSGDIIRTKSYSKAEVTFDDDSIVRLGDSSQIRVKEYEIGEDGMRKKATIDLERGRIRAIVSKAKHETNFDINTPNASGSVKGSDIFMGYKSSATSILVADGMLKTVNPAFPEEVINIGKGSISLVPYNAPPQEPRIFLPMEKDRYEAETGPTIKEIKGIEKLEDVTMAMVVRVAGSVQIQPAGSKSWHAPTVNEVLNIGDKIITEKNGMVEIALDNGHILILKPNTQIILRILSRDPKTGDYENSFECNYGRVIAKLRKIKGGSSFKIKTPVATCGVRGTIVYLMVIQDLMTVFFEGGDGFVENLISGIKKIAEAGQTISVDGKGNIYGPEDTTDEDRRGFGNEWGNENGDLFSYTPPEGETGDDLTGPDFGGPPEPDGDGEGPFGDVPPGLASPPTGVPMVGPTLTADFNGIFGNFWTFIEGEEPGPDNSIAATILSTLTPAPWSGLLAATISGIYSRPAEFSLWAGVVDGVGSEGGSVFGFMGGTWQSWEGILTSLYIDPSGIAGILFGAFSGINDDITGAFSGEGEILVTPVGPTDVLPENLSTVVDIISDIAGFFVGIFDVPSEGFEGEEELGYLFGEFSLNLMSLPDEPWGIWEGVFASEYNNPNSLGVWEGGIFAFLGEEGFEEDDFLFGLLTGVDDSEGSLDLLMTLYYLEEFTLTTLGGIILGNYEEADSYYHEGIGFGSYEEAPLTFSGIWGEEEFSLYENDGGDIKLAGEDFGFMGATTSPWLGPADFVARGGYWSYDKFGSYIWNTLIHSFNYDDENYTTYDGAAFFGYTGGIWNNFIMDGAAVALYLAYGTAGFLTGDVSGFYLPFFGEGGIWAATGTLSPTPMVTGIGIDPEDASEYIDNGYLEGAVVGDFDGTGEIKGWSDWGDTYFIHDSDNQTGYPWGIYDIKFGDGNRYYNPEKGTSWSAMIGGEGNFGVYYPTNGGGDYEWDWGFWLADATGTSENGEIRGDLIGDYITRTHLGTIGSPIFGLYDWGEDYYGSWIAESLGTWIGEPLTFSGYWGEDTLYYNDGGELDDGGEEYGLIGATSSPWNEPAPFLAMGEYYNDGEDGLSGIEAYIWNTMVYSYNAIEDNYTTIDGGAFFGYTGGIWNDGDMDGSLVSIYIDPDGNAGFLTADVNGNYYPFEQNGEEWGMWMAEGTLTAERMVLAEDLGIDPEDLEEYIDSGSLEADLEGLFLLDEDGYIEGQDDWGNTYFISNEGYPTMGYL